VTNDDPGGRPEGGPGLTFQWTAPILARPHFVVSITIMIKAAYELAYSGAELSSKPMSIYTVPTTCYVC